MTSHDQPSPRQYKGVTISSTFQDLEEHRDALIDILTGQGLFPIAMEHDSARPGVDVIDSSIQKVRDGAAYIGIISRRYGQVPECPRRNPDGLSITELEFDEALRLGRSILLFVMGEKHPVREADVELDPDLRKKLQAFRDRAKLMGPDSRVQRVYDTFESLEQFRTRAARAVAELGPYLQAQTPAPAPEPDPASPPAQAAAPAPLPAPPAFYAEPPYIGSHAFVGRQAELDRLSDWAAAADPHPVLLFEAIGGTGKSMLTWEWTTRHATAVRGDWAGRFWYSFYERGAIMADFCRRALAYITGRPLEEFRKKKTPELSELLLRHLRDRPWLLVLDGLERVLVAYHRFDAAQVADEEAGTSDQIAQRDPCNAIRPEDDELLRMLAGAAPSKLLLTTRLTPRVLLNSANQAIPGVLRVPLAGLRPPDAEALLRSCGITGTSTKIQAYLKAHCDCHPLVTGVLAGLINDYLPNRGNFDTWATDPAGGGRLNLAELDLVQKRNHILKSAIAAQPEKSRALLSTLALLSEAVDYNTLNALNPHLPAQPERVAEPVQPEQQWNWEHLTDSGRKAAQASYRALLLRRREYERALAEWRNSPDVMAAAQELRRTVRNLEGSGLLQYDYQARRFDLHPVVRGVVAGQLGHDEKTELGGRVVDFFSQQAHSPYHEAETLEDVLDGVRIVRTLLHMGDNRKGYAAFLAVNDSLMFNLEAYAEVLSLLRPFFQQGWAALPADVREGEGAYLVNEAGIALGYIGDATGALAAFTAALLAYLRQEKWVDVLLHNIAAILADLNQLAKADRCATLAFAAAIARDQPSEVFRTRFLMFQLLGRRGCWAEADAMWQVLEPMGRDWARSDYRPGEVEHHYAVSRLWRGDLREQDLSLAEQLAQEGKNRLGIRLLHALRGDWYLEQKEWALASGSFSEAIRMAHEVGVRDVASMTRRTLANYHLGTLPDARHEAAQMAAIPNPDHETLAKLWVAIGDAEQARKHALAAYEWAWADGEPYVRRYELNRARALLEELGEAVPNLPPYDPAKDEKFPWEDEVLAAIERIRAERQEDEDEDVEED